MDNIKRDTIDLYPLFWKEFENNRKIRNNLVRALLMTTEIDTNKFNIKITLANFCDLLIFLLKKVEIIFNNKLDNYLDVLLIMCVYSSLIRELNIFEKNDDFQIKINMEKMSVNLVEEFIEIFNNFESILENTEEPHNIDISNDISISINKTKDLYLRVCQSI